jgi:hypothetical protein
MRTKQNLCASSISQALSKGGNVNQEVSGRHFHKRILKTVSLSVFEQPIKFRFFEWIIRMSCKTAFRAEVAQSCMGRGVGHKKASRVVKHREAILKGVSSIYEGRNFMVLLPVLLNLVFTPERF